MAFLKKHFVWILLVLVLVAEGGVTFVLLGRRSRVKQQFEDLDGKKKRLAELEIWEREAPRLRKGFQRVRTSLTSQRDTCALFFWRRDQVLETLFDDPKLAQFRTRITPWGKRAAGFDQFRYTYQNVYNERADALVEKAEAMAIGRGGLGLASNTAFTQPHITIGDIYGAQKEYWLIEAIVNAAVAAEVSELDPIRITRGANVPRGRGRGGTPDEEGGKQGKLHKPITVEVVARCPYPRLARFVHKLHTSELPFRVRALLDVARSGSKRKQPAGERVRYRSGPRGMGEGVPPEAILEGIERPTAPAARRMPMDGMPPEMMEGVPPLRPGMEPVGVEPRPATRRGQPAPPAEQFVEAQLACEVSDFTLDIAKAKVTGSKVNTKDGFTQWLTAQVNARRRTSLLPLWRALLTGLATAEQVDEQGDALQITFRPGGADGHFDEGQAPYDVGLDLRDGTKIQLELRLVTFEPTESEQGVAKATIGR